MAGFIILWVGLGRLSEGWQVAARSRNLRRIDPYPLLPEKLPGDAQECFIGRGFLWQTGHTQLMYNLGKENIQKHLGSDRDLGGLSVLHGVGAHEEKEVFVPVSELKGHTLIGGTTRVGKTRILEVLITQSIRRGDIVIVFDPKGDEALLNRTVEQARAAGRGEDLILFALPYPPVSATYNPLQNFVAESDIPDRIVPLLPGGGNAEAFKNFSWEVLADVSNALLSLGIRPTLRELHKYSLVKMEDLVRSLLKKKLKDIRLPVASGVGSRREDSVESLIDMYRSSGIEDDVLDTLVTLYNHPRDHFSKMIASLKPVLGKLTMGEKGRLLSSVPADLDWERATSKGKIVYLFLGSLLGEETANAIGQMALQDFSAFIGTRYHYLRDRRPVSLFIDEFYNVVCDEFINVINKGGGAEIRVTMALQSIADLEAKLAGKAKARQILGNANTWIWLRSTDSETAEAFSEKVNSMTVVRTTSEGSQISPDFRSDGGSLFNARYVRTIAEKETDLLKPQWIMALPKGQGFLFSQGRLYKMRFPLLPETTVDYLSEIGVR